MAKKNTDAKISNSPKSGMLLLAIAATLVVTMLAGYWVWKSDRVAACGTAQLQLIPGQQSGAAGTIYQHMALKNTGSTTCTLSGFPAAFLYGNSGFALGSAAAARPQPSPVTNMLAPNDTVHTVLGYPQAGNFNPGVCSDKSVTLKLYPPGAITPLETPLEIAWCPGFSSTALQPGS